MRRIARTHEWYFYNKIVFGIDIPFMSYDDVN